MCGKYFHMCNAKNKGLNLMFFFCYILFDFSFLRVHTKVAKITCNPHKLLLHVLNSVLLSRLGSFFQFSYCFADFSTIFFFNFLLLLLFVCALRFCSLNGMQSNCKIKITTKVICQIIRDIKSVLDRFQFRKDTELFNSYSISSLVGVKEILNIFDSVLSFTELLKVCANKFQRCQMPNV